ncbi:caffeoyl-CoA O-methyltransferase [Folsomia candida]|uniref:caffeoyl-CoA O-methyltransferase n=1 Tax=Folsomia candida TaxID=158441 RepID=UPI000B906292|nr:caffeoyl-CoA O-methyltransferase [Folsomia candida]
MSNGCNALWTGEASEIVEHLLQEVITQRELGGDIDDPLTDKIKRCHEITSGQNIFLSHVLPRESEIQKKISSATLADPILRSASFMLSGHLVGELLKMVAEMTGAKTILEIGTFTGYSAVTLADTSFCEELVTLDNNPYCEEFLERQLKGTRLEEKIRVVIGHALDSLQKLRDEGKSFDMVFIDSNKTEYLDYYKCILDNNLLNARGVILCDNIMWGSDTFMDQSSPIGRALHRFVEFVKTDDRVDQMVFPLRDGVMLIRSK